EWLGDDGTIVAYAIQRLQESGDVDHPTGPRQQPLVVDLLVDVAARRGIVHMHVDHLVGPQAGKVLARGVGGIPVPAVEEEPCIARAETLAELKRSVDGMDKRVPVAGTRRPGSDEFQSEAAAVVGEDLRD